MPLDFQHMQLNMKQIFVPTILVEYYAYYTIEERYLP